MRNSLPGKLPNAARGEGSGVLARVGTVLHPFLFSAYAVLALLANNVGELGLRDSYRSLLVAILGTGLLLFVLTLALRNLAKAAIVCSLLVVAFFSYGHVYSLLRASGEVGSAVARHRYLIPLWTAALGAASWALLRTRRNLSPVNSFMAIVGLASLAVPVYSTLAHELHSWQVSRTGSATISEAQASHTAISSEQMPDIYYIVADSYARVDVLQERYGYDNRGFTEFLQSRGFYVAEESAANYLWTRLSLASSMNMDYITALAPDVSEASDAELGILVKHSAVRQILEGFGYATVGFATGWPGSELVDADHVFTPKMTRIDELRARGGINPFESMLIHNSALRILLDLDALRRIPVTRFIADRAGLGFMVHRETILGILENLAKVPSIPGPKFVFAHIVSPHAPFIFGPNGESITPSGPFTLLGEQGSSLEVDKAHYVDQLVYVTSRLEEVIDDILAGSSRPVIIILQADHGPNLGLAWEELDESALRGTMSILNAYYLPEECRSNLYPSISPVNSFRALFNCVFGQNYELLEDLTYVGYDDFVPAEEVLGRIGEPD